MASRRAGSRARPSSASRKHFDLLAADRDLDRRLVRLGPIEVDLDSQLLLEGPDHVLPAHHGLRHLVIEGEDDAAGNDVQHVGKDVQQLADVLER